MCVARSVTLVFDLMKSVSRKYRYEQHIPICRDSNATETGSRDGSTCIQAGKTHKSATAVAFNSDGEQARLCAERSSHALFKVCAG